MDRLALLAGSQSKPDLVQFGASRVDFAEKKELVSDGIN